MSSFRKKYIGDKAFYKLLMTIALPLVIQNAVSNTVNMVDNVMVGTLGTAAISGVAIVNQLIFVINISLFGLCAGASIFGAQYYGKGDMDGVRYSMRFKLWFSIVLTAIGIVIFLLWGRNLIDLFLTDTTGNGGVAETMEAGHSYLIIMLYGLLPFALTNAYSSTLRESGETFTPMVAGVVAILVNMVFNYLLIFGKFGCPKLGIEGAAIATVLSRYVELAIILISTHRRTHRFQYIRKLYRSLYIPMDLLKKIVRTGTPLFLNEVLWSIGMATINQSFSVRGLEVVAANNIASTAWNLFCIFMFSIGTVISIMVGQKLGAGEIEEAKRINDRLLFTAVSSHVVLGLMAIASAPFIPYLYNTSPLVRDYAKWMIMICGASMPMGALYNSLYFTLRCGGKTFITFLFDSCFMWVVTLPVVALCAHYTGLHILVIYALQRGVDVIRLVIGLILYRSGIWAKNLVGKNEA